MVLDAYIQGVSAGRTRYTAYVIIAYVVLYIARDIQLIIILRVNNSIISYYSVLLYQDECGLLSLHE